MAYQRFQIDLAVAHGPTPAPIDGGNGLRGTGIGFVTVLSIPPGAVFNLHFGQQANAWDVLAPTALRVCGEEQMLGLFYSNPAGAGLVILEVSYAASGPQPVAP
jgi:hypothetical protein